jgi:hypothetical protein
MSGTERSRRLTAVIEVVAFVVIALISKELMDLSLPKTPSMNSSLPYTTRKEARDIRPIFLEKYRSSSAP